MNASGVTVAVIAKVMNIDKVDIEARSNMEEDLGMDDYDIEEVLGRIEDKLNVELIEFFDSSECKTVGQLVRFIKKQLEL